ncbi:MAG TPA: lysine--tRNA ligase [Kiritimatiellia bacterium]|jgi:lysyl-tRNA synthetase class 2|nr:lysine--tRNA ligase [Kiritimatiellia bacterium]HOE37259.1 lysine--tRNA ligase [Kiritimatiellia bacterium]HOR73417.1 lysine--tRNA ligase [Kiritimatiellia bacterium]HOU58510.1 lysine--tRNA ligase [Kiritimatiellia bacterium]HPK69364.1 lysine--tRNA ligase [Kiritimatiellia bacterium]
MELSAHEKEFRQQRLANLATLQAAGHTPYGRAFARTGTLAEIRAAFAEGRPVQAAGRVVAVREMGKSTFAHLQDGTDKFQIYLQKNTLGEESFTAFKAIDLGDFIGVSGELFTTRTGEQSLKVAQWELLAKSLHPLPEKWHGLQDTEVRYRQRYLDLIANPEVRRVFNARSRILSFIRRFLEARGYFEVETPVLQTLAGGAIATPFKTFYNALGQPMYMRIAPELYLKRLLVGGYDKVFELGKNYRNEGLDRSHNPEFTALEVYEAYGDVRTMMKLVEELVSGAAQEVCGTMVVGPADGEKIDLTPPWRVVAYHDLVREHAGADWFERTVESARDWARARELDIPASMTHAEITHEVYDKLIEKKLMQPTFVTRLPAELVPLAKRCPDNPALVDVFELVVRGRELCPGYTELNDPLDQRARLEEQAGGDAGKLDEDFLRALEYGMPPAGGMGVGIDRLVMVLTGEESVRDVMLFPQMKTRAPQPDDLPPA